MRILRSGVAKPYRTSAEHRLVVKLRRDELRARKLCVNNAAHGKARGSRCDACAEARRV